MNLNTKNFKGLAFDIDGVVARIMPVIRSKCDEVLGRTYERELEDGFVIHKALGLDTEDEAEEYVAHCLKSYWEEIEIDSSAEALTRELYRFTGRAIPFVTHRHRHVLGEETYRLIERFIKVPYTIAFAGGTKYQNHWKWLYIPEGYHFVEDNPGVAHDLKLMGIFTWLIRTDYNNLDDLPKSSKVAIVDDLSYIYEFYFD